MWSIIFYKSLAEKINGLHAIFAVDPEAQVVKRNKVAGARARKALLELEKTLKEFRMVSIEAGK